MKHTIVAFALVMLLSGCLEQLGDPPVSVRYETTTLGADRALVIFVTATADEVTVNSVKVNNGNCASAEDDLPAELKMGERYVHVVMFCNIVQVSVNANGNDWDFTFE